METKLVFLFALMLFVSVFVGCGGSSASAPIGLAPADDEQVTGAPVDRTPPVNDHVRGGTKKVDKQK